MAPVFNYLAIPARGEATRVALAVAGVDFEDKRMSFEEFGASEFKTCPVYQVRQYVNRSHRGFPPSKLTHAHTDNPPPLCRLRAKKNLNCTTTPVPFWTEM